MARRSSHEVITHAGLFPVATGVLTALVAPDSNARLSPRTLQYGVAPQSPGSGIAALYYYSELSGGNEVEIWKSYFFANQGGHFEFPSHFEVPNGSGIAVSCDENPISVDLYYVSHDSTAGTAKTAARTATLIPSTTRAPNGRNF